MKYPTMKFVFDRKKTATKTKTAIVYLEISHCNKRRFLSTGIKLYADQWHDRRMVVNSVEAVPLNEKLTAMINRFQDWINSLIESNTPFDFDKLEAFIKQEDVSDSYIEYLSTSIEKRNDITEGTKKNHRKLVVSLNEFGFIRYFSDLTYDNLKKYDNWLHFKYTNQATIHSYHKFNKVYINMALRSGIIKENPYNQLTISRGKQSKRKYLEPSEIEQIASMHIPDASIARVRDLFLFQCYTGFAYAELSNFDFSKILQRNGKYVVADTRQKTDEDFYIVLMQPAIEILQKYDYKLPIITNQQYNMRLKVLASYCQLDKNITTHMARHSFAVMALNNGVSIEKLAKMMGHTDIATTQIYAKIIDTELEKEFEMLENKIMKR